MSYIRQYVKEQQLRYPSIGQNCFDVLRQLLFTSSDWVNGNPVVTLDFHRTVPFSRFYEDEKPFAEMRQYWIDYHVDAEIEQQASIFKSHQVTSKIDPYRQAYNEVYRDLNGLEDTEAAYSSFTDPGYWYTSLMNCKSKYAVILYLHSGFIPIENMNENTEHELFEISEALVLGFLKYYKEIHTVLQNKKSPFGRHVDDDGMARICKSDTEILQRIGDRLSEIRRERIAGV